MRLKLVFLIFALLFIYSCKKEEQSQILPYIQITVDSKSFKMDSVIAVYDDSAGVMSLIGVKYASGTLQNLIAIGFKFSSDIQVPKTYDATRTPIEMVAIYIDSTNTYSTATVDSLGNPASPIGTGILNLTLHNLTLHTIAGNFELRPKEIDPQTWEVKTKTIYIKGSFQTYYVFLTRGASPPVPLKIFPMPMTNQSKFIYEP
ncbi:hypothetical protein [Candidatus Kryptobacter tengchongensis]|uniref:Uncharacterized protein n=1 Tax=Kryptobacter tengchongensis TaxID=1643429 RepID=A0A656D6T9_KRYT1|nr:hypothetical protein [Candidatus Kryptobacter tengchongensis]CUT01787.1 hypothetical protein JGI24_01005 [Candidatus Kryptobacter tengchongensis]